LGTLAVVVILIVIPTFLTQAGGLRAQEDMCDGGSLTPISLYEKGLLATYPLQTGEAEGQFCLRLLLTRDGNYYVFYPYQTSEVGGEVAAQCVRDSRRAGGFHQAERGHGLFDVSG